MSLVKINNGKPMVSTKDIADKFNKNHRDVIRAVNQLECSDEFRARNFAQSFYTSKQNKKLSCYEVTKDGFAFLCMGFTGKEAALWKERYIDAFNFMEHSISKLPATMETMNILVKEIEKDKGIASLHGRELAKYKKVKKLHEDAYQKAEKEVQLLLGFN